MKNEARQQIKYLPGQKTSKNILPGLELEKVENHCPRPAMSKRIVLFATNVANEYGHSPHSRESIFYAQLRIISKRYILGHLISVMKIICNFQ